MRIRQLIALLQTFPDNLEVFLATTKHETLTLCDCRDQQSRGERIILISSRGVWDLPKDKQC